MNPVSALVYGAIVVAVGFAALAFAAKTGLAWGILIFIVLLASATVPNAWGGWV